MGALCRSNVSRCGTVIPDLDPKLARDAADRAGRRRRMIIMPMIILAVAGVSWWWGKTTTDQRHVALFEATTAFVQGPLLHTARPTTSMTLRWADPAMESIFLAGIASLAQSPTAPMITVRTDLIDDDNTTPVEITAGQVSMTLLIRPTDALDIGVIQSITCEQ